MFPIIIGLITAFNFLIILKKVKMERYLDAFIDIATMAILTKIFGNSEAAMVMVMVASLVISLSLLRERFEFLERFTTDDSPDTEHETPPMFPTINTEYTYGVPKG